MPIDSPQPEAKLDPGVFLIETHHRRSTALHQAALGYLAATDGSALWFDACDHRTILSQLDVPWDRTPIQFSRSRDAHEHNDVIRSLPANLFPSADLVVVSCVASFYEADAISERTGERYLESTLSALVETADVTRTPIFVSCVTRSNFIDRVREAVTTRVTVEPGETGFQYEPEEFEAAIRGEHSFSVPAISGWDGQVHPFAYMGTVEELVDRGFVPDGI